MKMCAHDEKKKYNYVSHPLHASIYDSIRFAPFEPWIVPSKASVTFIRDDSDDFFLPLSLSFGSTHIFQALSLDYYLCHYYHFTAITEHVRIMSDIIRRRRRKNSANRSQFIYSRSLSQGIRI